MAPQSSADTPPPRSLGCRLWCVVLVINLAILLLAVYVLNDARQRELSSAQQDTVRLTHLASQDVTNEFEKIDIALQTVVTKYPEYRAQGTRGFDKWLADLTRLNPSLNVLGVTNAAGDVIDVAAEALRGRISLADRPYFRTLRDQPGSGLQVFGPVLGRSTDRSVMILARRLVGERGEFQGVVFGSIPVEFFHRRFAELIPDGHVVTLHDAKQQLILRYPVDTTTAQAGQVVQSAGYLAALAVDPRRGSYRSVSALDGVDRLASYRQDERFGFYASVGVSVDVVLAAWRRQAEIIASFLLLFLASSIVLGRQLHAAWRNQARVAQLHREAEQRLRLVAENTARYVYEVTPERTIAFVNRVAPGLDAAQLIGSSILECFPPLAQIVVDSVLDECFRRRERGEFEYEATGQRGEQRNYWAQVTPVLVADRVASAVITIVDITERKHFEQQVLNSRELLRQFLDHFPGLAFAKDESFRIVMASRGFKAMLGLEPQELLGRRNTELFPGPLGEKFDADDSAVLTDGKTRVVEDEYRGRFYESTKFRIAQQESWLLAGLTVDVTQRHRAAARTEALLRLGALGGTLGEREFLAEGLQLVEQVTGSKLGVLHLVSEDQATIELVCAAPGARDACGLTAEAACQVCNAGIWAESVRRRAPVRQDDTAASALDRPSCAAKRLVSVPVIDDGKVRMLLGVANKPGDYDDYDVETVQLIGNDLWRVIRRARVEAELNRRLSELTELNRKLAQAQNQLLQSEKMATIGQLAAGVAHELNNPIGFVQSNLGSLSGYVDDLLELIDWAERCAAKDGGSPGSEHFRALAAEKDLTFLREDVRQLLAESKDGADRVRRIVQNLKDFSHVSDEEWVWADLHKGLDSTLNIVWNEIKYKAEVEKRYTALPEVYCVPSQLNQVFMNLLVNAAQAIEGKGKLTITTGRVEAASPDGETGHGAPVWIEISDTGKGIPEENLARIFDPFFTTKPVGQGTGLGLSLAWSIIQKHHGTLTVSSTVGVGSTFRITLPVDGRAVSGVPCNE